MSKKLLIVALALTSLQLFGAQYSFNSIKNVQDYEAKFTISNTKKASNEAVLDCQSFIHRLDIYNHSNQIIHKNVITYNECEDLYRKFQKCLKTEKKFCIDSEYVFSNTCKCE
jgi:hypothetical protein